MNFLTTLLRTLFPLILLLLFPWKSNAQSIDSLETVLKKADSLEAFLESPDLIDEYYRMASKYFGTSNDQFNFRRSGYLKLIDQLKWNIQKNPELASILWRHETLGKPFQVHFYSGKRDHFPKARVRSALKAQLMELEIQSQKSPFLHKKRFLSRQALEAMDRYQNEMDLHHQKIAGLSKKKQKSLNHNTFLRLQQDPEFIDLIRVSALVCLRRHIREVEKRRGDETSMGRSLLNMIRDPNLERFPVALRSFIKKQINQIELQHRPGWGAAITRSTMTAETIRVRPPPRRFHSVFLGLANRECVSGGDCDEASVTGKRWGLAALRGGQHYLLENKAGRYAGWIILTEVQIENSTIHFGALDEGARILNQDSFIRLQNGEYARVPLFDLLIWELEQRLPSHWKGILYPDNDLFTNSGAFLSIRRSLSFHASPGVIDPLDLVITDQEQDQYFKTHSSPTRGNHPSMIFSAGELEDHTLVWILQPIDPLLHSRSDGYTHLIDKNKRDQDPKKSILLHPKIDPVVPTEPRAALVRYSPREAIALSGIRNWLSQASKQELKEVYSTIQHSVAVWDFGSGGLIFEPPFFDRHYFSLLLRRLQNGSHGEFILSQSFDLYLGRDHVIELLTLVHEHGAPKKTVKTLVAQALSEGDTPPVTPEAIYFLDDPNDILDVYRDLARTQYDNAFFQTYQATHQALTLHLSYLLPNPADQEEWHRKLRKLIPRKLKPFVEEKNNFSESPNSHQKTKNSIFSLVAQCIQALKGD